MNPRGRHPPGIGNRRGGNANPNPNFVRNPFILCHCHCHYQQLQCAHSHVLLYRHRQHQQQQQQWMGTNEIGKNSAASGVETAVQSGAPADSISEDRKAELKTETLPASNKAHQEEQAEAEDPLHSPRPLNEVHSDAIDRHLNEILHGLDELRRDQERKYDELHRGQERVLHRLSKVRKTRKYVELSRGQERVLHRLSKIRETRNYDELSRGQERILHRLSKVRKTQKKLKKYMHRIVSSGRSLAVDVPPPPPRTD